MCVFLQTNFWIIDYYLYVVGISFANRIITFQPQLCFIIISQSQMSLYCFFRLMTLLPTYKAINKPRQTSPELHAQPFKQLFKTPYLHKNKQPVQNVEIRMYPSNFIDPIINIQADEPIADNQQELVQQSASNKSCETSSSHLTKNHIDSRIKILQYQANNPSEDTCTYEQLRSIDAYTVSIFDGHGGPELAQYSKSKISKFIDSYLEDNLKQRGTQTEKSISQILKESIIWSYQKLEDTFFQIYQEQIKIGNRKIKNVGTCGITAIVHNNRVYVGNSGDSQGIFIVQDGMDNFRSLKANNRLSVNNRAQRERLRKQWADKDQNIIQEQYNNCFYLKGRLQPTRTIGDYYLKKKEYYTGDDVFTGPYLHCKPDVNEHQISKQHKYMVIASDGLWDVLNKEEVTQNLLLQQQIDLNKTCYDLDESGQAPYLNSVLNSVLSNASQKSGRSMQELKRMQKGVRRNYHDDITIAVINLQNQS